MDRGTGEKSADCPGPHDHLRADHRAVRPDNDRRAGRCDPATDTRGVDIASGRRPRRLARRIDTAELVIHRDHGRQRGKEQQDEHGETDREFGGGAAVVTAAWPARPGSRMRRGGRVTT
jgi:hypothetical protein